MSEQTEKAYDIAVKLGLTKIAFGTGPQSRVSHEQVTITYETRPECAPTHTWMAVITAGRYEVMGFGRTRKQAREHAIAEARKGFYEMGGDTAVPILPPNYDVSRLSDDEIDEPEPEPKPKPKPQKSLNKQKILTIVALVAFGAIIALHYQEIGYWGTARYWDLGNRNRIYNHETFIKDIRMPLFVLAVFYTGLFFLLATPKVKK
jgi:hypothetical protein